MALQLVTSRVRRSRIAAQEYAKKHGKTLASCRVLDEGVMSEKLRYRACARELVAYPASGEVFKQNEDIVDPAIGSRIPLEFVRGLDIYRPGVGLVVDPEEFDTHRRTGGLVLLPASISVLDNFIQRGGIWVAGKPDESTMLPLEVSKEVLVSTPRAERRNIHRVPHQGVRSVTRIEFDYPAYEKPGYGRRSFDASANPKDRHWLAFEEQGMGFSRDGDKLIVRGTPAQLDSAHALLEKSK